MLGIFSKTKNNNTAQTFEVARVIATTLNSRDIIILLKDHILKSSAQIINLDFSSVTFISRSAAHELILIKEDLIRSVDKRINFINTNSDVTSMLRTVAANRIVPKNKIIQKVYSKKSLEALATI